MFGPPGSGKGTQSEILVRCYGLKHISTGNILRDEIAAGSDLGKQAQAWMDEGKLAPDEIVMSMISQFISENKDESWFLFDGFPRTEAQAIALHQLLATHNIRLFAVIFLQVPDDLLISRLIERGQTSGRTDDNEETIKKRLTEYIIKTEPVIAYYKSIGVRIMNVDGVGEVGEIATYISEELEGGM